MTLKENAQINLEEWYSGRKEICLLVHKSIPLATQVSYFKCISLVLYLVLALFNPHIYSTSHVSLGFSFVLENLPPSESTIIFILFRL